MMIAPVGGRKKVIGSSMATVAVGPSPGRTPIRVPRRTPMKQNIRFSGVAAMPMP